MAYVFILAILTISGIICHIVASRRGSNKIFWGAMGFSFGPLAIPFVFISKPSIKQRKVNPIK